MAAGAHIDGAGGRDDAAQHGGRRSAPQADGGLRIGHDAGAVIDEETGSRRNKGQADRLAQAVGQNADRREIAHDGSRRRLRDAGRRQERLLPQRQLRAGGDGGVAVAAIQVVLRETAAEE